MGSRHQRLEVKFLLDPFSAFQLPKILDVSLGSADGRIGNIKHCKATFLCILQKLLQYLEVDGGIADDALFPHLFPSRFKLRLDEAGNVSARF